MINLKRGGHKYSSSHTYMKLCIASAQDLARTWSSKFSGISTAAKQKFKFLGPSLATSWDILTTEYTCYRALYLRVYHSLLDSKGWKYQENIRHDANIESSQLSQDYWPIVEGVSRYILSVSLWMKHRNVEAGRTWTWSTDTSLMILESPYRSIRTVLVIAVGQVAPQSAKLSIVITDLGEFFRRPIGGFQYKI